MLLSRAVRASWSIAAVLLVATLGRIARADNTAANEGAFQHLRALQDIASASGGNRAAGRRGADAGICRCSSHLGQFRLRRRDRPAALGESSPRCGVTNGVS